MINEKKQRRLAHSPLLTINIDRLKVVVSYQGLYGSFRNSENVFLAMCALDEAKGICPEVDERLIVENFPGIVGQYVQTSISGLNVRIRNYTLPLAAVGTIDMRGTMVMSSHDTWEDFSEIETIPLTGGYADSEALAWVPVRRSFVPIRVYFDMNGDISHVLASFTPAYEYALVDLVQSACRLAPGMLGLSTPLCWWDMLRVMLHGKAMMNIHDVQVRVMSPTAISSSHNEQIFLSIDQVQCHYETARVNLAVAQINIAVGTSEEISKQSSDLRRPAHRSSRLARSRSVMDGSLEKTAFYFPILFVSRVDLAMSLEWQCLSSQPFQHYVFPIVARTQPTANSSESTGFASVDCRSVFLSRFPGWLDSVFRGPRLELEALGSNLPQLQVMWAKTDMEKKALLCSLFEQSEFQQYVHSVFSSLCYTARISMMHFVVTE